MKSSMAQEDKELLLKDLCARLPYGTICEDIYGNSGILFDLVPELNSVTLKISELGSTWTTDIDKVKPYLRPMSSMSMKEKKEMIRNFSPTGRELLSLPVIDWLNSHYFDYRGLIEKGLALEAHEGMYNNI